MCVVAGVGSTVVGTITHSIALYLPRMMFLTGNNLGKY
jgi:hypothetical protein